MKHIIPILTVATLTIAAQSAKEIKSSVPLGLSYNRVAINYNDDAPEGSNGYSVTAETLIGSTNFWLSATSGLDSAGNEFASFGYLIPNIAFGIDATPYLTSNDEYGIIVRRNLNEVLSGLEARLVYSQNTGTDRKDSFVYELAYNINKTYQVAVSIHDRDGRNEELMISARYNF